MRRTKDANAFAAALIVCLILAAPAQAEIELRGYAKSFFVAQESLNNDLFDIDEVFQSQNSLRLMIQGFGERTAFQLHYEASPVFTSRNLDATSQTFNVVSDNYRLSDLQTTFAGAGENNKNKIYQNLDRLNIQFQFDAGDLTVGRQAISFGSARIINPIDVFLPFDVRTFNTEYRTGVDAVRFQRAWGELGEIDIGVVLGDGAKQENSAAFIQIRNNYRGADYQLALIEFSEQHLAGLGVQTALGDFGFWFEAAQVSGDENYTRMSTGLDYTFGEDLFAQIEYHYNGAGSGDPSDYLLQLETIPYQSGGVFLLGEHYLIPAVTWQLSPLWYLAGQAIVNLSDSSAFLTISAEYNVAENFYMDFGYYHFLGDDLSVTSAGTPVLESEYGPNPSTVYTSIRYYF